MALGAAVAVMDPEPGRAAAVEGAQALPYDLDGVAGFDGVVVASPTVCHRAQAEAALAGGGHVLVEKPLDVTAAQLDPILAAGRGRIMVGYNLRLHEPVQRIVSLVRGGACGQPGAMRLWFGSYLPDWRPGVDYRTTYSARSDLGGGVLLDAIHELDLAIWLLDERLTVVAAVVERLGRLEIDVEDTVRAVLRHAEGTIVDISLDYLSRRYRRGIEVIGDEATARLDWARGVIEVEAGDRIDVEHVSTPVAVSYEREAEAFLAFVAGALPPVDGPTGAASVRLADRIRQAAR